ncbi:unnamed protein product [Aureobasidium vineae]|uniref:Uncharacterized protein n=1 Tax=Aureobasidium vineae TaxID=2773715 RepID=A0A9N8JRL5_9PEZI|nr:unnamed protein product [Aureobasidium vineae]
MTALRHESAAMCPRCGYVTGRMKEGCDRKCTGGGSTAVLAKEVEAKAESPGIAKAYLSGLEDTIREELQLIDQDKLTKEKLAKIGKDCAVCVSTIDQALLDGSASSFTVLSDVQRLVHSFVNPLRKNREAPPLKVGESDVKIDKALQNEKASRKRAPTGDPLFQRFMKKAKTGIIEDEEDKIDLEAGSDGDDDRDIHDEEDDGGEFDVDGEDEYAPGNDDDEAGDELEEDHVEW